jgi:nucleotide-binding universal stress UspA family protein
MGTIVVGVDGSEASLAALRFAADEARLRGARLTVVHAWIMPVFESVPDPFLVEYSGPIDADPEATINAMRGAAETVIDEAVEALGEGAHGLEIERAVIEDRPERALVDAAEEAELLVVGSRGHGRLHNLVLGSVSHYCVQHARCPVEVVPSGQHR